MEWWILSNILRKCDGTVWIDTGEVVSKHSQFEKLWRCRDSRRVNDIPAIGWWEPYFWFRNMWRPDGQSYKQLTDRKKLTTFVVFLLSLLHLQAYTKGGFGICWELWHLTFHLSFTKSFYTKPPCSHQLWSQNRISMYPVSESSFLDLWSFGSFITFLYLSKEKANLMCFQVQKLGSSRSQQPQGPEAGLNQAETGGTGLQFWQF